MDTIQKIHNLIILDESGSMYSIYEPALDGVNETLQTIRKAKETYPEQDHFVTLVTFNTGQYNKINNSTPIEMASDFKSSQYHPRGSTPLYDAIGKALNDLRLLVEDEDIVLVTIITDGYENASREFTGKAIKVLIDELKKKDWVFTYIGANQDVENVAISLSINNHISFDANVEGTKMMFAKERSSRSRFFDKIHRNSDCIFSEKENIRDNYFEDDEISDLKS